MPGRLESSGEPISPLDGFGDQARNKYCEVDEFSFQLQAMKQPCHELVAFPGWWLGAKLIFLCFLLIPPIELLCSVSWTRIIDTQTVSLTFQSTNRRLNQSYYRGTGP